jgi:adenosylcobyric acid synthase
VRVHGRVAARPGPFVGAAGCPIDAYEIHAGRTEVMEAGQPFEILARRGVAVAQRDGASSSGGNVVGTYLHGLFENDTLRRALLAHLAGRRGLAPDPRWGAPSGAAERYDRLADIVAASCDLGAIGKLVGLDLAVSWGARTGTSSGWTRASTPSPRPAAGP